jgi:hypothetical protein
MSKPLSQKELIKRSNKKVKKMNKRIDALHIVDPKSGKVVTDIWKETK